MWVLYISCAWVAGIFLGSKFSLPLFLFPLGFLPFLFIPVLSGKRKNLIVLGLCLFALFGGILRFPSSLPQFGQHDLCFYNDGSIVEVQGMVAEAPDIRSDRCRLKLSSSAVSMDGEDHDVSGTVLIWVPRYPGYRYGDVLKVVGELETPPQFEDFDYRGYLATQGIYAVMYYPGVDIADSGQGDSALQWLYSLRENLSLSLSRALPEPQGSLAQGLLLGIKGNIPHEVQQAFSRTGTAHLLAISGLHLGIIIAMFLGFGVLVFGRRHGVYVWLALAGIWFYVLLTGMHPPVIRGAIMGSLFLLAELLGRQRSAVTALTFAAAVMVGFQPQVLWSVSFQLSFLAMVGLISFYPLFRKWGRGGVASVFGNEGTVVSAGNMVVDAFAMSLAAILAVYPLVVFNFKVISLVGLPATFLALPALPPIIVTSAVVAFSGLFAPVVAQITGCLDWLFLSYLLGIVRGFDALPFSSFSVSIGLTWPVWGYYIAMVIAAAAISRRRQLPEVFSRLMRGAKK